MRLADVFLIRRTITLSQGPQRVSHSRAGMFKEGLPKWNGIDWLLLLIPIPGPKTIVFWPSNSWWMRNRVRSVDSRGATGTYPKDLIHAHLHLPETGGPHLCKNFLRGVRCWAGSLPGLSSSVTREISSLGSSVPICKMKGLKHLWSALQG